MAQQTAVMAIAKAFRNWQREWDRYDKEGTNKPPSFDEFVKPFLQIEKEQIVVSFYEGMKTNTFDPNMGRGVMYYNETYGKNIE